MLVVDILIESSRVIDCLNISILFANISCFVMLRKYCAVLE